MNFLSANTTNHRRVIMFVATLVWGVFMALVVYKIPLTFREFIFPPIVGLAVFEFLFRTRKYLRPLALPPYIIMVIIVSVMLYEILYNASYGSPWSPISALQYLFSDFKYFLYALVDSSIVTGLAYYLIKIYRHETWVVQPNVEVMGNEPVFDEGPMTFNKWLRKNSQQVTGFIGWYAIATVVVPFSYGLITTPATVIFLIAFGLSKKRKGVAGGILVAVSLNLVISLIRGLSMNATCFMPFYFDKAF